MKVSSGEATAATSAARPRHASRAAGPDPSSISGRWRVLATAPASGTFNMALDEALMARAAATGEAFVRAYAWARPTLSLGRNQAARGCYDAGRAAALGVDIVRRPTGGRALLHWRELTYSIAAPARGLAMREAYARLNAVVLRALRALGVDARLAGPSPGGARPPDVVPCYVEPSEGEIVVAGRKLVGSAQWREAGAILQHGSILIDDDQPLLADLMTAPAPRVPRPATLREALGRVPSVNELADALGSAVAAAGTARCEPLPLDAALAAAAREREARYADPEWTWRR